MEHKVRKPAENEIGQRAGAGSKEGKARGNTLPGEAELSQRVWTEICDTDSVVRGRRA
jgi:hypothetical protein